MMDGKGKAGAAGKTRNLGAVRGKAVLIAGADVAGAFGQPCLAGEARDHPQ